MNSNNPMKHFNLFKKKLMNKTIFLMNQRFKNIEKVVLQSLLALFIIIMKLDKKNLGHEVKVRKFKTLIHRLS